MATKSVESEMQDPTPIEVEAPTQAPPAPAPSALTEATLAQASMLDIMKAQYKSEPRVRVKVKNDGPVHVQVNGYSFLIRENEWVEVPESLVPILDDAGYI